MSHLKKSFRVQSKITSFYSGGQVEITSDGQHLFCPNGDRINILDTSTGRVVYTLKQDDDEEVTCISLSPDNEILVAAYRNLLLKQWAWREQTCTRTWKAVHIAPIICMSFEKTSTLLATGSSDSTIKVWDIAQQYCTHNLKGSQGIVNIVQIRSYSDKIEVFAASVDNVIRVWDLQTSKCKHQLAKHYGTVTSLAFSEDNKTMFSAGRDSVVIVWDLDTYTSTRTIPVYETLESVMCLPPSAEFQGVEFKPERQYFITAGAQGELKVWDSSNGCLMYTQKESPMKAIDKNTDQEAPSQVTQATLLRSHDSIMVVTFDHNILFFGVEDFKQQKQFVGNNEEILDVKYFGPNQSHLAIVTNSPQIRVYELATFNCQLLNGHTDIILNLAVFKKGLMLASGSKDNSIRLWQMSSETGHIQCVAIAKGHTHSVLSVCTARLSSSWLASGGEDCTIKFWNVPSEFETVDVKNLFQLTVKYTERAHEKSINSIAVSPNDKLLATGSQDKTAKLYHVDNQELVGTLRGHKRGIWCVQFSPTDQALATSSADGTIKIWTLSDFSCVKTFEGHDASVLKFMFLSKGMQILSSGSDGLLKLWTIKNNECVTTIDEHTEKVWGLDHSKGEIEFISGGADGAIVIWNDVTLVEQEEEIQKEEQIILQEQKMNNYLQEKKFLKALRLAITLGQPFNVLKILRTVLDGEGGLEQVESTLKRLRQDQIISILGFVRVWNTNAKHCHIAQTVLSVILRSFPADDLMTFPNVKETLEGLMPYTDRHLQRMNRLSQQATFVEFIWQNMRRATDNQNLSDSSLVLGMEDMTEEYFHEKEPDQENVTRGDSSDDSDSDADVMKESYEELLRDAEKRGSDQSEEKTQVQQTTGHEETSESEKIGKILKQFRAASNKEEDRFKEDAVEKESKDKTQEFDNDIESTCQINIKRKSKRKSRRISGKTVNDVEEKDFIEEDIADEPIEGRLQEDEDLVKDDNSVEMTEKKSKRRKSGKDLVQTIRKKRKSLGSNVSLSTPGKIAR